MNKSTVLFFSLPLLLSLSLFRALKVIQETGQTQKKVVLDWL